MSHTNTGSGVSVGKKLDVKVAKGLGHIVQGETKGVFEAVEHSGHDASGTGINGVNTDATTNSAGFPPPVGEAYAKNSTTAAAANRHSDLGRGDNAYSGNIGSTQPTYTDNNTARRGWGLGINGTNADATTNSGGRFPPPMGDAYAHSSTRRPPPPVTRTLISGSHCVISVTQHLSIFVLLLLAAARCLQLAALHPVVIQEDLVIPHPAYAVSVPHTYRPTLYLVALYRRLSAFRALVQHITASVALPKPRRAPLSQFGRPAEANCNQLLQWSRGRTRVTWTEKVGMKVCCGALYDVPSAIPACSIFHFT
ncbi:hypothetical protein GGX14DRAFT_621654 [Mycena pura]|uniref:Uncharacterized protein n=1 Tax=Mycena pura TaxID=153505 RepID=A0AAD6VK74_9AGAR|nr:hypothetical protein GGX14DRAFT_621654 [Mycena pura]